VSLFKSEKFVPISVRDVAPVARELAEHFKQRDYQVECVPLPTAGWEVGITRGGIFKAAVGLKSALKIQIEPIPAGTMVRAGAGIFGKQAIPTAISMLVAWPVLLTQVWGLVREAGLDGEAVGVVEASLNRHQRVVSSQSGAPTTGGASGADGAPTTGGASGADGADGAPSADGSSGADGAPSANGASAGAARYCSGCGGELGSSARFCPACGQARVG
jgi:hypothetical protein